MADLETLIEGYRRFHTKYFVDNADLYQQLSSQGQSPKTLVIACSDSRVCPSILTDASPGEVFMIRNVANLVPPYGSDEKGLHGVSAALEFAVLYLEVEHIIVMGHGACGGIAALMENTPPADKKDSYIATWMQIAYKARERALAQDKEDPQTCCEKEAVLISLANLQTFPWIKKRVEKQQLQLHGWHFSLEDGTLAAYDPAQNCYIDVLREKQ